MEILLSLIIPWTMTVAWLWPLSKLREFKRCSIGLQFSVSLFIGCCSMLLPLTVFGLIATDGFILFAKIIFFIQLFLSFPSTVYIARSILAKKNKYSYSFQVISILLLSCPLIFISMFKPVIDSDVVSTYLPLARSIIKSNNIPLYNAYNGAPFVQPPVGAPVFFAYYYAISGNIISQSFIYSTIPFLIGFIIVSKLLIDLYISPKYSLFALGVFLTLPLLTDMVFTANLYPDIIFSFCMTLCLYLVFYMDKFHKQNMLFFTLIGLLLALSLLLKFQAIFLYIIVFILILTPGLSKILRVLGSMIVFLPFIILSSTPYKQPRSIEFTLFLIVLFVVSLMYAFMTQKKVYNKFFSSIIILGALSALGFIFVGHTIFTFHNLHGLDAARFWAISQEYAIGVGTEGTHNWESLAIFVAPELGLFWVVAKLIGLVLSFFQRKSISILFIFTVWYVYWVNLLGSVDLRWLLPLLPLIAIIIVNGIELILCNYKKVNNFVSFGIIGSLLSSKFVFWNLGIIIFGTETFRSVSYSEQGHDSLAALISTNTSFLSSISYSIRSYIFRIIFLLTSRTPIQSTSTIYLGVSAFIVSCIGFYFFKRNSKVFRAIIISIYVVIHIYIILAIGKGNPINYANAVENNLYDYWGQSTVAVPYLQHHAKKDDVILSFSIPTGLSYFMNLPVYNLQYSGGLFILKPIFEEKDQEIVYNYLKKHHIRFIVILSNNLSKPYFERLLKITPSLNLIKNPKYVDHVITPTLKSYWDIYQLK